MRDDQRPSVDWSWSKHLGWFSPCSCTWMTLQRGTQQQRLAPEYHSIYPDRTSVGRTKNRPRTTPTLLRLKRRPFTLLLFHLVANGGKGGLLSAPTCVLPMDMRYYTRRPFTQRRTRGDLIRQIVHRPSLDRSHLPLTPHRTETTPTYNALPHHPPHPPPFPPPTEATDHHDLPPLAPPYHPDRIPGDRTSR
jgi:hypothetical protein